MTTVKFAERQAEVVFCQTKKTFSLMLVFEFILNLNIPEALTRVQSIMIELRNSFELPILNEFLKIIIYTAIKLWIVKDLL